MKNETLVQMAQRVFDHPETATGKDIITLAEYLVPQATDACEEAVFRQTAIHTARLRGGPSERLVEGEVIYPPELQAAHDKMERDAVEANDRAPCIYDQDRIWIDEAHLLKVQRAYNPQPHALTPLPETHWREPGPLGVRIVGDTVEQMSSHMRRKLIEQAKQSREAYHSILHGVPDPEGQLFQGLRPMVQGRSPVAHTMTSISEINERIMEKCDAAAQQAQGQANTVTVLSAHGDVIAAHGNQSEPSAIDRALAGCDAAIVKAKELAEIADRIGMRAHEKAQGSTETRTTSRSSMDIVNEALTIIGIDHARPGIDRTAYNASDMPECDAQRVQATRRHFAAGLIAIALLAGFIGFLGGAVYGHEYVQSACAAEKAQ